MTAWDTTPATTPAPGVNRGDRHGGALRMRGQQDGDAVGREDRHAATRAGGDQRVDGWGRSIEEVTELGLVPRNRWR